jgi:hypothetical protein
VSLGIRTDCSTNDGLKWSGAVWVCTGGPSVTGSGTTNRVAKWTAGYTLGNTAFPIDDTSTTLTVGDDYADLTTIKGRTTLEHSDDGDISLEAHAAKVALNFVHSNGTHAAPTASAQRLPRSTPRHRARDHATKGQLRGNVDQYG